MHWCVCLIGIGAQPLSEPTPSANFTAQGPTCHCALQQPRGLPKHDPTVAARVFGTVTALKTQLIKSIHFRSRRQASFVPRDLYTQVRNADKHWQHGTLIASSRVPQSQ